MSSVPCNSATNSLSPTMAAVFRQPAARGEGGQRVIPTILIPFDASARTALAVQYATAIASRTGGNLILYAVIPDEGVRNYAESQLARVAEEITRARVGVTTRVDCGKEVASAIV